MATFPADSIGLYFRTTIAAALSGAAPEDKNVWSSQPSAGPYVPNPDFWLSPRPTCVLWKHPSHGRFNGCLITAKHVVLAKHTSTGWAGTNFRFCKTDGTVCDRVSTARTVVTGTDIAIATLNADVDAGITPAKLLPDDFDDILVGRYRDPVPSIIFNRGDGAAIQSLHWDTDVDHNAEPNPDMLATRTGQALDSPYDTFFYTATNGDSGSPWMVLVDGVWCLIGCMDSSMSAPAMHAYYSEIAAITGGGYAPSVVDLSGYTVPDAATPEAESSLPIDVPLPETTDLGNNMATVLAYPTSIVLDDGYSFGDIEYNMAWTTKDNAAAEDGSFASVEGEAFGASGDYGGQPMNAVAFDFSAIPDTATIDGFLVEKKDKFSATGYSHYQTAVSDRTSLVRASGEYGAGYGDGHVGTAVVSSGLPTTTLAWRSWGGATEKFGRTWTVAQVKSAHFGPKFLWAWEYQGGAATTYQLDSIRVTVYYTAAAGGGDGPSPITLSGTSSGKGRSAITKRRFR